MNDALKLGPAFAGEIAFSHRAWLFLVTAARRDARASKNMPIRGPASPVVRVQVLRQGATLCGTILEPCEAPDGAELYRVELEHLGRCTVSARNVRVCGGRCVCGGGQ